MEQQFSRLYTVWGRHVGATPIVIAGINSSDAGLLCIRVRSLILFNDSAAAINYTLDIYRSTSASVAALVAKGSIAANSSVTISAEQTPFFVPNISGEITTQLRVTPDTAAVMDYLCAYAYVLAQ